MLDFLDHAAHRRRILEHAGAVDLVEAEADRAADLRDLEAPDLVGPPFFRVLGHGYSFASVWPRRPMISETLRPRRAAISRGDWMCWSASNVALIMLCGFEVPTDFATTSWTPRHSKIARIGPPAMMPVPGGAARTTTRPAPKRPFWS